MKYFSISIFIICVFLIFQCKDNDEKDIRDFNKYSFNTILKGEGTYNIGYKFDINKKFYADKEYDFIYYSKNFSERKFLIPGSLSNDEFPIYWREVNLPFKIIKKANNDTLLIIKNNKEFIFKRVKNTD